MEDSSCGESFMLIKMNMKNKILNFVIAFYVRLSKI